MATAPSKRKGAGPAAMKKVIPVAIETDRLATWDKAARNAGLSRSEWLRRLADRAAKRAA